MRLSSDWLARLVPHDLTPTEVRDLLTAHVATVEGFEPVRSDLLPFVVARVIESEKVPDTKLTHNKVDDGSGELLEVICGAPNVTVGQKYPFARTGTTMPNGMKIEKKKIRGLTSNGMLCSARELGLGDDSDGILPLNTDEPPGTPLLRALPAGDVRLELDVLPNRPDLLSHLGVARELAALTGKELRGPAELADLPPVPLTATRGKEEASVPGLTVRIDEPSECLRFAAAVITGVTVCPSPLWLRLAVEAIGGRSINNVVDATNYMLHGFGQPMHAYDKAKLGGDTLVVRRARKAEKLQTLDGVVHELDPEVLVISDLKHATGLAGVMGGKGSEVTSATTDVVLEVANFAAKRVRTTRRRVGLSTDASYRFERGVDESMVTQALALGAALIAHVSGGHVASLVEAGRAPVARASVELRVDRVARVLGDAVPAADCARLLGSIGCVVESSGKTLKVTPPSWRHDLLAEVDLIEEVARLRGFDRLPDTLAAARPGTVPDHPLWTTYHRVRDALVAAGLHEVRPLPFTSGRVAGADRVSLVRVQNPLAEDEPFLRGSLVDTLARRAEFNLNRMQGNVRLFEIGSVFCAQAGGTQREEVHAALLVMGLRRPPHFTEAQPPAFDAWDAKSLAITLAQAAFPAATVTLESGDGNTVLWYVRAGAGRIGTVVRVALDAPVWANQAFAVDVLLGMMPNAAVAPSGQHAHGKRGRTSGMSPAIAPKPHESPVRYRELPTTPAAEFDLALIVPEKLSASEVEQVLRTSAGELLERCFLFDEFRGAGVPEGARSLAWRLTFRHPERTLREKEIDGRRAQLLKALEDQLGVRPRTV